MAAAIASNSQAPTGTDPADGTIEIHGRFSTLRISPEQLRAYLNDQLGHDEAAGARGAVGVRPVELATTLLKTELLTMDLDFDKLIAHAIEHRLWPTIRPQLPT